MDKSHAEGGKKNVLIDDKLALRKFFESAPMMMGLVDVVGDDICHITQNEAVANFFGQTTTSMEGKRASQLGVAPETIKLWISNYRKAEYSQRPVNFEYRFFDKYLSVDVSFVEKTPDDNSRFTFIVQDITEKRQNQENLEFKVTQRTRDLKRSQEQLNKALESAQMGIWEIDLAKKKVSSTKALTEMFDLSSNVNDIDTVLQHVHPLDRDRVNEQWQKAAAEHFVYYDEYRVLKPDGSIKWVLSKGATQFFAGDSSSTFSGVTIDITNLKRTEENLRNTEERFEIATTKTGVGVWDYDLITDRAWRSLSHDQLHGEMKPLKQWTLETALQHIHPDDHKTFLSTMEEAIKEKKEWNIKYRVIWPDKSVHWVEAEGHIVFDDKHNPVRLIGKLLDITDNVKTQEMLKESEERFKQIANGLPLIVWTANENFEVDWYNDWWYSYIGKSRGTAWDDLECLPMHPDDVVKARELMATALRENHDKIEMYQRFRSACTGEYRWHISRGSAVKNSEGKTIKWVGANSDIHDEKILMQKLEEERELRERFVAALSHDLRTPLAAARMTSQFIRKSNTEDERLTKSADRITMNLDRVDNMIQDLLDVSTLSAGKELPLKMSKCDLSLLVHETLDELGHIHGRQFKLEEKIKSISGIWDCSSIRRILENLCNNAIKYGEPQSPITVTVFQDPEGKAGFTVHNFGKAIPSEELKHLFEPYKRASTSTGKRGWGIGLMLVKGVVDAHGGSFSVESDDALGTTFTILLPGNQES